MAGRHMPPDRRWYFLGGEFRNAAGRTTDPEEAVFPADAWCEYSPEVSFQLSESFQALKEKSVDGDSKLLDLSMFSDPPLPYEIWQGRKVAVRNPGASARLRGQSVVGGFRADFWTRIEGRAKMLPASASKWVEMGVAHIEGCFYQVHHDHVSALTELSQHFADETCRLPRPAEPRKRVVMMVEFPAGWFHRTGQAAEVEPAGQEAAPLEEGDPPVYEWWYGDRPSESECLNKRPRGFWRRYHPRVCRRLECAWQHDVEFQKSDAPIDVDGVRYMLQRISQDRPFAKCSSATEALEDGSHVTVNYPVFEEVDRVTENCLVQFRREDPNRRRPARRRMNAEEIARNAARTGQPCCICFSEEGEVTGCTALHVVCGDCLRAGLRVMVGDITVLDKLLCGCFSHTSRRTVTALAERSDEQLRASLAQAPADEMCRIMLEDELKVTRRQFDLGEDGIVPPTLYVNKVEEWYDKVIRQQIMPSYHVCSNPACANEVDNWMLRETFDEEYRAVGKFQWTCPMGHVNSVLPRKDEILEVNRTILMHPEYYVESAVCDGCPLRRYRLCRECVDEGHLLLAVHADGCKQWPGGGSAHRHCFCFSCTRRWNSECDHCTRCTDPGIQQVRSLGNKLEIGFIDGQEYLCWLRGERQDPPPTVFPTEPRELLGTQRQRELRMENCGELLLESQAGTL